MSKKQRDKDEKKKKKRTHKHNIRRGRKGRTDKSYVEEVETR